MKSVKFKLSLLAFCLSLPSLVYGQACIHLGEQVTCPDGVSPGTSSSTFDGPNIIWGDGAITPRDLCCDPFMEMVPTDMTPEMDDPSMDLNIPIGNTPETETPEVPDMPETPDMNPPVGITPDPELPTVPEMEEPGANNDLSARDTIELNGPMSDDEELRKIEEEFEERKHKRRKMMADLQGQLLKVSKESRDEIKEAYEGLTGPSSKYVQDPNGDYCGPDVTVPFLRSLRRIRLRMAKVPDSEKGLIDGNLFMMRGSPQAQSIDYWSSLPHEDTMKHFDWKGSATCPTKSCFNKKNGCYTFAGACFPRHVFSDIMYGFIADQLWLPEFDAKAGGAYAQNSKPGDPLWKTVGAVYASFMEDLGPLYIKDREDGGFREASASIAAYKFGDEISEEFDFNVGLDESEIDKGDLEALKEEVYKTWPMFKKCKPCPDKTPLEPQKDFSDDKWLLSDDKAQKFLGDDSIGFPRVKIE